MDTSAPAAEGSSVAGEAAEEGSAKEDAAGDTAREGSGEEDAKGDDEAPAAVLEDE